MGTESEESYVNPMLKDILNPTKKKKKEREEEKKKKETLNCV